MEPDNHSADSPDAVYEAHMEESAAEPYYTPTQAAWILNKCRERIREMELDRDALLRDYREQAQTGGLATFTPEQRHEMYRRMRLTVRVSPGGYAAVDTEAGSFPAGLRVDLKHHMIAGVKGVLPTESGR